MGDAKADKAMICDMICTISSGVVNAAASVASAGIAIASSVTPSVKISNQSNGNAASKPANVDEEQTVSPKDVLEIEEKKAANRAMLDEIEEKIEKSEEELKILKQKEDEQKEDEQKEEKQKEDEQKEEKQKDEKQKDSDL